MSVWLLSGLVLAYVIYIDVKVDDEKQNKERIK